MSTNFLLIFVLVILAVMSLFVPQILGVGEFGVGESELPDEPSVWDVLTFNAAWLWAAITFSIPDLPWVFGTVFWFASFIMIYCIFRLVRGTA